MGGCLSILGFRRGSYSPQRMEEIDRRKNREVYKRNNDLQEHEMFGKTVAVEPPSSLVKKGGTGYNKLDDDGEELTIPSENPMDFTMLNDDQRRQLETYLAEMPSDLIGIAAEAHSLPPGLPPGGETIIFVDDGQKMDRDTLIKTIQDLRRSQFNHLVSENET